jgi:hypothetical protein
MKRGCKEVKMLMLTGLHSGGHAEILYTGVPRADVALSASVLMRAYAQDGSPRLEQG